MEHNCHSVIINIIGLRNIASPAAQSITPGIYTEHSRSHRDVVDNYYYFGKLGKLCSFYKAHSKKAVEKTIDYDLHCNIFNTITNRIYANRCSNVNIYDLKNPTTQCEKVRKEYPIEKIETGGLLNKQKVVRSFAPYMASTEFRMTFRKFCTGQKFKDL